MAKQNNPKTGDTEVKELLMQAAPQAAGMSAEKRVRAIQSQIRKGVLARELGRFTFGAFGGALKSLAAAFIGLWQSNQRQ